MKNKLDKELRTIFCEVRATGSDDEPIIEGMPIVFEKKTDIGGYFEETIKRGALDKCDLRDVPLLVNHDMNGIPVARSRRNNGNSTMTLKVETDGLAFFAKPDTKNNLHARELYSAVQRGDITGMSFCFAVGSEEWRDEKTDYPKRDITSIAKVFEVSAVTFPAYDQTSIQARSKELENAKVILEEMRKKNFGKNSDVRNRLKLLIELECLKK